MLTAPSKSSKAMLWDADRSWLKRLPRLDTRGDAIDTGPIGMCDSSVRTRAPSSAQTAAGPQANAGWRKGLKLRDTLLGSHGVDFPE